MALEGRTTELQDNPRFFYHNSSISTGILSRQQQIVNVHIHHHHHRLQSIYNHIHKELKQLL